MKNKIFISVFVGIGTLLAFSQTLSPKTSSDISIIVSEDIDAYAEHWWGIWYDVYELNRTKVPVIKNDTSTTSTTQSTTIDVTVSGGGSTGGNISVDVPVEGIPVNVGGNNNLSGNATYHETNSSEVTQNNYSTTQPTQPLEEDWHQAECKRNDASGAIKDYCSGQSQHAVGSCTHSDITFYQ